MRLAFGLFAAEGTENGQRVPGEHPVANDSMTRWGKVSRIAFATAVRTVSARLKVLAIW